MPYRERITVLYIKVWLLIDKLKVYGIQFKKNLGLTTFGSGGGRGVVNTFGEIATLGGGRYLFWGRGGGGRYFRDLLAAPRKWR